MPTIQVMSDLHFEFHRDGGATFVDSLDPSGVDVLIVAGDLTTAELLQISLQKICKKYKDSIVVYVLGNHDYYGSSFESVHSMLVEMERPNNLHVLNNEVIVSSNARIVGTTLWFRDDAFNAVYAGRLTDFRAIEDFAANVYEENEKAIAFLNENVQEGDIVVTHHMPSFDCVAPVYKGSDINRFFACELSGLIMARQPTAWVCGHTHSNIDMVIGGTRIIANPLGYITHNENPQFDDDLRFEV